MWDKFQSIRCNFQRYLDSSIEFPYYISCFFLSLIWNNTDSIMYTMLKNIFYHGLQTKCIHTKNPTKQLNSFCIWLNINHFQLHKKLSDTAIQCVKGEKVFQAYKINYCFWCITLNTPAQHYHGLEKYDIKAHRLILVVNITHILIIFRQRVRQFKQTFRVAYLGTLLI